MYTRHVPGQGTERAQRIYIVIESVVECRNRFEGSMHHAGGGAASEEACVPVVRPHQLRLLL